MKKKTNILIYILFFIAAFFIMLFVLLEFRNYYIAVAGAFVVLLVSSYLLFHRLIAGIHKGFADGAKEILLEIKDTKVTLGVQIEEVEKIQKAIYMASKKHIAFMEEKMDLVCNGMHSSEILHTLDQVKESLNSLNNLEESILANGKTSVAKINQVLHQQRVALESKETDIKTILKFDKENARQVAENANLLFEKENLFWSDKISTIGELLSVSGKALLYFDEKLKGLADHLKSNTLPKRKPKKTNIDSDSYSLPDDISADENMELVVSSEEVAASTVEPEIVEDPEADLPLEFEQIIEPEIVEEIADEVPEFESEPIADTNRMMSADEIAAMVAGMSEPVPVKEPEPIADTNRMMSADEIAAMIANMNN